MSNLTNIERIKLEKLFDMGDGYVLDFTNITFAEFIHTSIGIEIYGNRYDRNTGSKANRLRAFWNVESNYIVGKLTADLLEYWRTQRQIRNQGISETENRLYDDCMETSQRLMKGGPLDEMDAILAYGQDGNSALLVDSIRESMARDEPGAALDRLHTFTVKYVRQLCDRYSIPYDRDTPLHSLFGGYVKYLVRNKKIESSMTDRILKSSISILESFNTVRNEQSFAHDNPILNYNESIFIVNTVLNSIKFIESIERPDTDKGSPDSNEESQEDIPF